MVAFAESMLNCPYPTEEFKRRMANKYLIFVGLIIILVNHRLCQTLGSIALNPQLPNLNNKFKRLPADFHRFFEDAGVNTAYLSDEHAVARKVHKAKFNNHSSFCAFMAIIAT